LYKSLKILEDQKFCDCHLFAAIVIGLLNILFHNIWEDDWRLLITLIGWLALFIGLSLFIFQKEPFYIWIISILNLFR